MLVGGAVELFVAKSHTFEWKQQTQRLTYK